MRFVKVTLPVFTFMCASYSQALHPNRVAARGARPRPAHSDLPVTSSPHIRTHDLSQVGWNKSTAGCFS